VLVIGQQKFNKLNGFLGVVTPTAFVKSEITFDYTFFNFVIVRPLEGGVTAE